MQPHVSWKRGLQACLLGGVLGAIATAVLIYGIASLLYGERTSWNEGQGDGFVAFLLALGAAGFGACFWAAVSVGRLWLRSRKARALSLFAAALLFGAACTISVVAIVGA